MVQRIMLGVRLERIDFDELLDAIPCFF